MGALLVATTIMTMFNNIVYTIVYTMGFFTSSFVAPLVLVSTPLSVRGACSIVIYMTIYSLVLRSFVFDILVDSLFRLLFSSSEIFDAENPVNVLRSSTGDVISRMLSYFTYTAILCYTVYSYVLKPLVSLTVQRVLISLILLMAIIVYIPLTTIHTMFVISYYLPTNQLTVDEFGAWNNVIFLVMFIPSTNVFLVISALCFCMLFFRRVRQHARFSPAVFVALLALSANRVASTASTVTRLINFDFYVLIYPFTFAIWTNILIILLYTIIPVMFIIVPGRVKRCIPQAVASSPRCRRHLRMFMKRQYCEENFDFLTVTAKFRAQFMKVSQPQQDRLLDEEITPQQIYDAYISDSGDFQVNLRQDTCLQILHRIKSDEISADLFEQAERDVWAIINGDVYPRFLSSDEYAQMELMLRHGGAIKAVSVIGAGFILARQGIKERLIKYGVIKDHASVDESWVHPFMRPDEFKFDRDAHKNVEMMENPLAQAYPAVEPGMFGVL
ncbi:Regulator of G protein signaling domain [Carpediemonas membranifera]|uniref:Regulator of G protein signaling domain n=1 Tax=Carpediemonas membranifera TaxID=201153 RepID=A0A8J6B482_9EUKA|nr:Regulator of G protein signaling domain [Carpediemonas membranifera]|eukprot:KAG9393979.1 Regulator of G protein signaling domain [Carpediemonas membranifera]